MRSLSRGLSIGLAFMLGLATSGMVTAGGDVLLLADLEYQYYLHREGVLLSPSEYFQRGSFRNATHISMLVYARVKGPSSRFFKGTHLSVSVTEGEEILLERTFRIGLLGDEGSYTVPILLNGGFCKPLRIQAKLESASAKVETASRRIEQVFSCGE